MHTRLLLASLTFLASPALAQSADTTGTTAMSRLHNQDLSFFTQAGPNSLRGGSAGTFGFMYRQNLPKRGHRVWLRAGAGFNAGNSAWQQDVRPVARDTALAILKYTRDRGALAFVGVEKERHFTSNIHLFAAAEVQAGYTAGRVDSSASIRRYEADGTYNDYGATVIEGTHIVHSGFGGLQGSLGARAYYRRLVASLEIVAGARFGIVREQGASIFDFSLGGFGYRVGIGYRF